ncbi:hypothetical protein [Vibrio scophthalmi]|uniref:Uncharacterized protein n=1 Tax=Vibrio scophthalmi TaxID=45658 RepID=A0A1E3WMB2_9VIBR|nr:hypothetical protein [Vibrio scophthalmi]ODS10913.1 hypothetical protein VSF3289_01174 [Vibrio scophthalmi]
MHPLQNGTQTADKPDTNNQLGAPGYFTESGTDGRPSIPGADYFNAQIDEFKTLLAAGNVEFDRTKFNHILMAIKAVCRGISQFTEYNPERVYFTGEVCFTKTGNEITYWQWYSNQEWIAGKDPLDNGNRHLGWTDTTKPFYWIPYVSNIEGMPFYWLDTRAPEWAVMEINVDLPKAVYWRLARRYPHLVHGDTINTGEIRGEFLRVLDQDRGIDENRILGSYQKGSLLSAEIASSYDYDRMSCLFHAQNETYGNKLQNLGFERLRVGEFHTSYNALATIQTSRSAPEQALGLYDEASDGVATGTARPNNIARPMAIAI